MGTVVLIIILHFIFREKNGGIDITYAWKTHFQPFANLLFEYIFVAYINYADIFGHVVYFIDIIFKLLY